jgi:medium-chain acyl-[acyl-carrier-protein] hydrolase
VWAGEELVITGTSLWLWIDLRTRMLTRVPQELASLFPVGAGSPPYRPDIEKLRFAAPSDDAPTVPVSVRYSDFDANGHVNNTAFFDFLQTALVQSGRAAHPRRLELQFQREIPTGTTSVAVRLAPGDAGVAFAICGAEGSYAQGIVA